MYKIQSIFQFKDLQITNKRKFGFEGQYEPLILECSIGFDRRFGEFVRFYESLFLIQTSFACFIKTERNMLDNSEFEFSRWRD